jgi:hypothetical protein
VTSKAKSEDRGLIDSLEVCRLLGVRNDTWRKRVAKGLAPLPHSVMGRLRYYRKSDVRHFLDHGTWPAEMKFRNLQREAS